jgi:hypothetical protein
LLGVFSTLSDPPLLPQDRAATLTVRTRTLVQNLTHQFAFLFMLSPYDEVEQGTRFLNGY